MLHSYHNLGVPAELPHGVHRADGRSSTILLVDDSPVNLDLLRRILRADGFQTMVAADGSEALNICASSHIDLVVMDVMMPGQDGFQVCAELKRNSATRDIPVIFLSALDDTDSRVRGLSLGAVDYIGKPFDAAEIRARVRVHLKVRQQLQSLAHAQAARFEELRHAQQSILPVPEDHPDASFAVYYKPLDAVGGDFYDVVPFGEGRYGYFVADISGHGVGASFLTSAVKALLHQRSSPACAMEETIQDINSVLRATFSDGHYLTACYAQVWRQHMTMAVISAGHPPLIHVANNGTVRRVHMEGDPLGVFGSVVVKQEIIELSPGDRIYLYTDGLIEQRPGCARARGLDALAAACSRRHHLPLKDSVSAVVDDVRAPLDRIDDDLLLLGVEVRA